jgi:hypothetical protein
MSRPVSEGAGDDWREGSEGGEDDSGDVGVGEVGVVVGSSSDTGSGGNTGLGIGTGNVSSAGGMCGSGRGETGSSAKLLVGAVVGVPSEGMDWDSGVVRVGVHGSNGGMVWPGRGETRSSSFPS